MKRRSWFALALGFGLAGYVGLRRYEHKPEPRRIGESRTAHRFRIIDGALRRSQIDATAALLLEEGVGDDVPHREAA